MDKLRLAAIFLITLLFFSAFLPSTYAEGTAPDSTETDYLAVGNQYLEKQEFKKAEEAFRLGLKKNPEQPGFRSQIALALIEQQRFDEAEKELNWVLERNPNDVGASWYLGLSRYNSGKYPSALVAFWTTRALISKEHPQYFLSNWYIGACYQKKLYIAGLTQEEIDAMVKAFRIYLEFGQDPEERAKIEKFLAWVKENRPPENISHWMNNPSEKVQLRFDDREWEVGYESQNKIQSIVEYVLKGETVENWTEMVTAHRSFGLQDKISLEEYMNRLKQNLSKKCPSIRWDVHRKSKTDITYSWEMKDCEGMDEQYEIGRLIRGKLAIHNIRYTEKSSQVDPVKHKKWIQLLEAASLVEK